MVYLDIVSILCDLDVDLDIKYQELTALVAALKFQKKEIADYLISKMTYESLRKKDHEEAIFFASLHGYYDIVSILCDLGVNLNISL